MSPMTPRTGAGISVMGTSCDRLLNEARRHERLQIADGIVRAAADAIARSLKNRPHKRLGFMKPSERLAELLAMTG